MVTLELPVLVMVTVCAAEVVPVVTLPKDRLVGLIPKVSAAATAVPLRLIEVGEAAALLTTEMLPEAGPAEVGAKAALMVVCWPAVTLRGSENPLTLKGAPDAVICVMVNVAV